VPDAAQGAPLADVLAHIVSDVVSTQEALDQSFVSARSARAETGEGLNPVWFRLDSVRIALELVTSARGGEGLDGGRTASELICSLPNPVSMALYGRDAVTSTRISVEIAPIAPRSPR
jgi:hypothetical protein